MKARSMSCKIFILGSAIAMLGACGVAEPAPLIEKKSDGKLSSSDEIPAPKSKTILTVAGAVRQSNSAQGIELDMRTLEQLPITETTIYEPFLKKDVTFSGIMMDDFVEVVGGVDADAVVFTALDDFQATLSMPVLRSSTVMLATRQEGEWMKVRAGGPIRIVFLDNEGSGSNTDNWIWSVAHMKFER